jgi:hypothetical protein
MAGGVAPALDDRNETAAVGADAGSMGGIAPALRGGAMSMGGIALALRGGAMSMRATARSETLRVMWWWIDDQRVGRQEGSRCDGRIESKGWLDGG